MGRKSKYSSLVLSRGVMKNMARKEQSIYVRDMAEGTHDYIKLKTVETINTLLEKITEDEFIEIINR